MNEQIIEINRSLNWQWLPPLTDKTIQLAIDIQQIPAPTFEEAQRAEFVANYFRRLKLDNIEIDDVQNVYSRLRGKDSSLPATMVVAHTDTVFPRETDLTIRREGARIFGPGIGDNSMGVAGMLALATLLTQEKITPHADIWFVATTGEEGLGDLNGMKAAFEKLKAKVKAIINLEGLAYGHIYHEGIAVRRLHITANAPGGHSWLHFGRESAVHGIVRLGARITELVPPPSPRTTFNIGIIEGGQSVNTIAATASLWLDMRSEEQDTLAKIENDVWNLVTQLTSEDLQFTIEVVGDRPAGSIPNTHPLVDGALTALKLLNVNGILETGSTDANVPLAAGYPAVTIGITTGGNAHRLDEFIEIKPVADGLRQLILLTLAASSYQTT